MGSLKKPGRPHLARWYYHVETLPIPRSALDKYTKAKSEMERGKKAKRTESVDVVLPNAIPGKVVVRFGESRVLFPSDFTMIVEGIELMLCPV